MTCAIRSELLQLVNEKRGREEGLDVADADLLDDLERWLVSSDDSVVEGEPIRRDYRSDGTGPIPKGRKLASVTGIMGLLGSSKEAIARWSAREAAQACANFMDQGAAPDDAVWRAKFEPFNQRDAKAKGGTLAHELVAKYVRGEDADDPFLPEAARSVLKRFAEWWDRGEYEAIHVELPLVDQQSGYGGTPDLVLRRKADGYLIVGDLKTGKGVYEFEHTVQIGGYSLLCGKVLDLHIREGLIIHVPMEPIDHDRKIVPIPGRRLTSGAVIFAQLVLINQLYKQLTKEGDT
jgi:hypothetical protein